MDQWKESLVGGPTASAACSFAQFLDDKTISRGLCVQSYMFREGKPPIDPTSSCVEFCCNSIQSKNISKSAIKSLDPTYQSPYPIELCIYMFGSTRDGRAVTVRVRGFRPFFDLGGLVKPTIRLAGDIDKYAFEAFPGEPALEQYVLTRIQKNCPNYSKIVRCDDIQVHIMQAFTSDMGYQQEPEWVARISCVNSGNLENLFHSLTGARTYNNGDISDRNVYEQFLTQTGLTVSKWFRAAECRPYDFQKYNNGARLYFEVQFEQIANMEDLYREPTLVMGWDTETYSPGHNSVPKWDCPGDELSLVCYNFYWLFSGQLIFSIAATRYDIDIKAYDERHPESPMLFVKFGNDAELVRLHIVIMKRFMPSLVVGYNDLGYDWPWIVNLANRCKCVDGTLIKRLFQHMSYSECGWLQYDDVKDVMKSYLFPLKVKTAPDETRDVNMIYGDGFIVLDMMLLLIRAYPKDQVVEGSTGSLDYFAKRILLTQKKVDLSSNSPDQFIADNGLHHEELHRIIRENDQGRWPELAFYCHEDVRITVHILQKTGIVQEYRSLSEQTRMGLSNSIWRAGSSKVLRTLIYRARIDFTDIHGYPLIINYAKRSNIDSNAKIVGAFVAYPEVGPEYDSPVGGFDIASLYPNVMIFYNLCFTRRIIVERNGSPDYGTMIEQVMQLGGFGNVHEVNFTYDDRNYTFWTVRHRNDVKKMGITALMLDRLYKERAIHKKVAADFGKFADAIQAVLVTGSEEQLRTCIEKWKQVKLAHPPAHQTMQEICNKCVSIEATRALLPTIEYEAASADARQGAMKIILNITYGALAAQYFPLFSLWIASAVTSLGKLTIRNLHEFATQSGYKIKYGDTDSMYICKLKDYYQDQYSALYADINDLRDAHIDGMAEYQTQLVTRMKTFYVDLVRQATDEMKAFKDELNQFLMTQHDSASTITIDFEGVMFPSYFFSKKVYAGLKHKDGQGLIEELFFKNLHIRGLDMVKQSFCKLTIDVSKRLLREILWPFSEHIMSGRNSLELIDRELIRIAKDDAVWQDYDGLTKYFKYKPNRQNIQVNTFIARLRARNDPNIPSPHSRFAVVFVKPDIPRLNVFGRVAEIQVGDKIEFLNVAKEKLLEIDRQYYFNSQLCTTFCKIIQYMWYNPALGDDENKESMSKSTRKYVEGKIKEIFSEGVISAPTARTFAKNFIAGLPADQSRVVNSMYTELINGQHFKITSAAPIELAKYSNATSIQHHLVVKDGSQTNSATIIDPNIVRADIDASLDRVRQAYRNIQQCIIDIRDGKTNDGLAPSDVEVILMYLDRLDKLRSWNAFNITRVARISFDQLKL